jgi:hypothetical protein
MPPTEEEHPTCSSDSNIIGCEFYCSSPSSDILFQPRCRALPNGWVAAPLKGGTLATLVLSAIFTLLLAAVVAVALKFFTSRGRRGQVGGTGSGARLKGSPDGEARPQKGPES